MNRSEKYKSIRDRATQKLTWLKFVDLQKGQFNNLTENYPFPLPALLIEFSDFTFSNESEHAQKGDGSISVYLYVGSLSDTFKGSEREDATLSILDKFDDLFQAFEGFSVDDMKPLNRIREYKPVYGKKYIMFKAEFTTLIDSKLNVNVQKVKPEPDIAPKFKF
ncbi:MAG: hypothetical protein PHH37_08345 [Paludibacter sp.]|nr:hypothetical protein [Paludibacter sp.]